MSQFYTSTDHFVLLPALLLAMFGCAVLLFDFWIFPQEQLRKHLIWFVALGEAFTAIALFRQYSFLNEHGGELVAFNGALVIDGFALFFHWLFLAATLIVALISYRYLEVREEHHGEYYGILMLAQCGMFFLASGTDLVTMFVGLELMAVSFYILVGFLRTDKRSNEAALKYLLLGAFSSGFLAYGFSLLYGMAGSTRLRDVATAVAARDLKDPILLMAIGTVSVGLFFKVSAVPFHMWAPDAYEGAPTSVTAFLSVGSKAASFALLIRLFTALGAARSVWEPVLAGVAVLSLTIGNFAAVTQTNTKRLLAYSSISHAGYMLLGLVAGNDRGLQGMLVYLLVYTFMNLGAFLVIIALNQKDVAGEDVADLGGLIHRNPGYALLMLVFLLSLAGIPPTAGFIGKYYIFMALVEAKMYFLAVIAALYVAVAVFYYFRMVRSMFVEKQEHAGPLTTSFGMRAALVVTGLATLVVGLYPEPFVRLAQTSLMR
ncbi:MAG: NADH-quinone oxidoreductase subunit N [Bryobacterales bacterium]|nr:NADH-quinone oxidoreductase subunit N [Bryobacterales bacterium]